MIHAALQIRAAWLTLEVWLIPGVSPILEGWQGPTSGEPARAGRQVSEVARRVLQAWEEVRPGPTPGELAGAGRQASVVALRVLPA